jgi:hypothetical protein
MSFQKNSQHYQGFKTFIVMNHILYLLDQTRSSRLTQIVSAS